MRFLKKLSQSLKMKKGEEIVEKKTGVEKIEREFPRIPKYCIPAQSAGVVSRRRKLLGEVIHPAALVGVEGGTAKGHRRHEDRADKRTRGRDGFEYPHTPRARRGLVPGIFARDRRGPPQPSGVVERRVSAARKTA